VSVNLKVLMAKDLKHMVQPKWKFCFVIYFWTQWFSMWHPSRGNYRPTFPFEVCIKDWL
jgi:hypothetical protein